MKWYGDRVKKDVEEKAFRVVQKATLSGVEHVKRIMYETGPSPSAPGKPPAVDFGRYATSIVSEFDRSQLLGRFGSNVLYGKFLELGSEKMAPRPHYRPTIYWLQRQFK